MEDTPANMTGVMSIEYSQYEARLSSFPSAGKVGRSGGHAGKPAARKATMDSADQSSSLSPCAIAARN